MDSALVEPANLDSVHFLHSVSACHTFAIDSVPLRQHLFSSELLRLLDPHLYCPAMKFELGWAKHQAQKLVELEIENGIVDVTMLRLIGAKAENEEQRIVKETTYPKLNPYRFINAPTILRWISRT